MSRKSSPFFQGTVNARLSLPFSHAMKAHEGVQEVLSGSLFRYSEHFDGLLVAYNNVVVKSTAGLVYADMPYFYVDVQLEALLFRPTTGGIVRATVSKISDSHLACLVAGVFNATVEASALADTHTYEMKSSSWKPQDSSACSAVQLGQVVELQVRRVVESHGLVSLECQLAKLNDADEEEAPAMVSDTPKKSSKSAKKGKKDKKRKRAASATASDSEAAVPGSEVKSSKKSSKSKKSKKPKP